MYLEILKACEKTRHLILERSSRSEKYPERQKPHGSTLSKIIHKGNMVLIQLTKLLLNKIVILLAMRQQNFVSNKIIGFLYSMINGQYTKYKWHLGCMHRSDYLTATNWRRGSKAQLMYFCLLSSFLLPSCCLLQ